MIVKRLFVTAAFVWLNAIAVANASFLDNAITAEWVFPDFSSTIETHDVLVGPGVELPSSAIEGNTHSIDVEDDYVLFSFNSLSIWQTVQANGWQFSDKNATIPEIVGFTIGEINGTVSGLTASDLSFTSDSVFANFSGLGTGVGSTIRLDIHFIPEPTTLTLAAFALGLLATKRRRR